MGYWIIDGKEMTDAEYQDLQRQEVEAKERVRREAALLMSKLSETYEALTKLLEGNADVGRQVTDRTEADEEIYRKLRWGLERANEAPRCRWVKQDGTACRSPQIRGHIYCYAHKQMMEARAMALRLPALEDANAIQVALMRVQKALIDDHISAKKAGLLLYSLQLAVTNIGQTTFGEADEQDLVTSLVDEEEAIRQVPNPFIAKGTESTEEKHSENGLPGIHGKPGQVNTDHADRRSTLRIKAEEGSILPPMNVERVEVPNVLAMQAGGANWDVCLKARDSQANR